MDELLNRAKLNQDDLLPTVHGINLTSTISSDEYKLLELDQEKLKYLMEGNRLEMKINQTFSFFKY